MNWTITRQELVLFHARHKRMRFIYGRDPDDTVRNENKEKESQPFIHYRQHAQNILDALWNIFDKFPTGTEITIEKADEPRNRKLGGLKIDAPSSQPEKVVLLAYLVYWRMCLNYEGWKEGSTPDNIILEFIKKIGTNNAISGSFEVKIETDFSEHNLSALLSTLPLSPYWDLWGVFSDSHKKAEPTLLDKIKDYSSPVYAAQLKYYAKKHPKDSRSRILLGYPASIRACYTDSARDGLATTFVSERDYYDYCYHPEEDQEKKLYRAYALFYDALTLTLSGDPNAGAANANKEKTVFYIAYQIKTSLDRHHFWHITLRPDDSKNATLEQLWAAWWPLHQQILDWPTLHTSLATELEQLDVAYAQGEIFTDIIDSDNKRGGGPFSPHESVCAHAYMLFPMSCVCYGDKVWAYGNYPINQGDFFKKAVDELKQHQDICSNEQLKGLLDDTMMGSLTLKLGSRWNVTGEKRGERQECGNPSAVQQAENLTGCKKDKQDVCQRYLEHWVCQKKSMQPNDDILFHNQHETGKDNLKRQRYRRLIEQQLHLAEQMNDANQTTRDRVRRNRERLAEELRKLLIAKFPWAPEILELIKSENWQETTLLKPDVAPEFNNEKLTKAGMIADILFFGDDPSLHRSKLLVLMTGGLHLYLSGILELHPVKGYTHTIPDRDVVKFLESWGYCKPIDFLSKTHAVISSLIKSHQDDPDLRTGLGEINALIAEWEKWLNDGNSEYTKATNARLLKLILNKNDYPAAKLTALKKTYCTQACSLVKKILNDHATQITDGTHEGSNSFRASLPAAVLFPKDLLTLLIDFVKNKHTNKNQPPCYRLFWLPLDRVAGWKEITARNYLAICYCFDGAKSTPPEIFVKVRDHLDQLGGKFYVVYTGDNGSPEWNIIENKKDDNRNDILIYTSINISECWPDNDIIISKSRNNNEEIITKVEDDFTILFGKAAWNTVLLLTFDSHYIPASTL